MLPVPLKLFPCQAFRSLGLLGVGGLLLSPRWRLCSCPIASLLEDIAPFSTARPFGWLCLRVWLLVAALRSPATLATVFCLLGGVLLRLALGRRLAVWGGAAADSRARFFYIGYKKVIGSRFAL